ncbi:hypothetical protein JVU11DRAFT_4306 [Chiua virens]|nr:hypothetical protein JVU11DRAFT_4306 [Chiua virens]
MFVSYRLFDRCVNLTPASPLNASPPVTAPSASSQAADEHRAILVWWMIFGVSLFFRPVAELVIRILFFSICALLIGTLNGTLTLLVGHALLKVFKCDGYNPPFLSSIKAGSLGGLVVIGPSTLVTIFFMACLGSVKLHRVLSSHITFLLEIASLVAISAAACAVGVTLLRTHGYPDNPLPLDATRAARAGVLGACLLTVPLVSAAALVMRETTPSAQNTPRDTGLGIWIVP